MDKITSGFIFVEPIPGEKEPKIRFRHDGITFSKAKRSGKVTITINVPEIAAHSLFTDINVVLTKNGELIPVSKVDTQTFIMKKNDKWTLSVYTSGTDPTNGSSSKTSMSFSNETKNDYSQKTPTRTTGIQPKTTDLDSKPLDAIDTDRQWPDAIDVDKEWPDALDVNTGKWSPTSATVQQTSSDQPS